jgi:hypothetical protein
VDFDLLLAMASTSLLILCALILGLILAETLRCSRHRARLQRRKAAEKAEALLMEWLSPAQLAQFESNGYFDVTGSHSGKRYRIRRKEHRNIDELDGSGARVAVWCFGPEGYLPVGDIMLTQKITLETNEQAALVIANRTLSAALPP